MLYFAYGSNMCTARLAERVVPVSVLGPATLADHRMRVDLIGGDRSAKCNIVPERPGELVHGVVFELDAGDLAALHAAEGPAYAFIECDVVCAGRTVRAAVYRGRPEWRDARLVPFIWYMNYVCAGAREHRLLAWVIDDLDGVPTMTDPDLARAAGNRKLQVEHGVIG